MHVEQPNEQLFVLLYTLNSGRQHTANLTKTQILEFIQAFVKDEKYVVTNLNETYGFNSKLISDFKVLDLHQKNIKFDKHIYDDVSLNKEKNKHEEISDNYLQQLKMALENKELENAYKDKLDLFKIECKCGANYVVQISTNTTRGYCNNCNEKLYVDRSRERINTYKGLAWLMTNKT